MVVPGSSPGEHSIGPVEQRWEIRPSPTGHDYEVIEFWRDLGDSHGDNPKLYWTWYGGEEERYWGQYYEEEENFVNYADALREAINRMPKLKESFLKRYEACLRQLERRLNDIEPEVLPEHEEQRKERERGV